MFSYCVCKGVWNLSLQLLGFVRAVFCPCELWLFGGREGGSCFDGVGKVERSISAVSALFLEDTAVAAGYVSGSDVFLD